MSNLCPHNQNPLACLACFQARNTVQATRPKESGNPGGAPLAPVVPFAQASNPIAARKLAEREAAAAAMAAKLPQQGAPAPVAPRPPSAEPAKRGRHRVDPEDEEGSVNGVYSQEQLMMLGAMFDSRPQVTLSHERHPEADSKPGQPFRR